MSTILRGNAAEAATLQALIFAGVHVLVPFGDGLCFDLGAVGEDGRVWRVQVKTGRLRKGCVEFNSASTDHGRGRQHYRGRADVFAVYAPSLSRLFMMPVDDCPLFRGYLRLGSPRNNQRRGVRLADDYSLEAWLASIGSAVAA